MASVTVGRIAQVQAHINEAVILTSARSTLPVQDQDRLLLQSCVEACDLLDDWLGSNWWVGLQSPDDGPISDCIASQEDFQKFLDPMFKDAISRAGQRGMTVPPELVDNARTAVADIGRRYRKMSRSDLFTVANNRIKDLKGAVCGLADEFRKGTQNAAKRTKARTALMKARTALAHFAVVVLAKGPQLAAQNLTAWAQAIMIHGVADAAQPGLTITPPQAGPIVR